MTKFGILDDFGEVIKWVWERPTNREYITVKVPKPRKPKSNLASLPDALF